MLVDDNSFGANNCTYVYGYECVPTNDEVDTSYFPIEQQACCIRFHSRHETQHLSHI